MTTDIDLKSDSTDIDVEEVYEDDVYASYRSVSKLAIGSLAMLLLGLSGLVFPVMLSLTGLGILSAWLGLRNVRRYPEELTGRVPGIVGLVGCIALLVGGSAMHTYAYLTEVPEGYHRISFADLQPAIDPKSGEPLLPKSLDGQRIFVKGYVHPGVSSAGEVKKFILVPDMGTCCFGGQPKLTDMIEVTIVDAPGVRYSQRKRKLGGILHVSEGIHQVAGGLNGGFYELRADLVK
jgi:hypothetical protein